MHELVELRIISGIRQMERENPTIIREGMDNEILNKEKD